MLTTKQRLTTDRTLEEILPHCVNEGNSIRACADCTKYNGYTDVGLRTLLTGKNKPVYLTVSEACEVLQMVKEGKFNGISHGSCEPCNNLIYWQTFGMSYDDKRLQITDNKTYPTH